MTDQQHPIAPPPEMLDQWLKIPEVVTPIAKMAVVTVTTNRLQMLATEAARWGSEQELDACCEWLDSCTTQMADQLRAARRPKPPSLKEQALALIGSDFENQPCLSKEGFTILRRALEALPE